MKIVKLVVLDEEDMSSARVIEGVVDKVKAMIENEPSEQIVLIAPIPKIIRDWLTSERRHYRLVRARYCAMASSLGVSPALLMDIFRQLNRAIEWAGNCGSVSGSEKQKVFLRFGERLSAELFAAALARRLGGEVVTVIDGVDFFGSHFAVSFMKTA